MVEERADDEEASTHAEISSASSIFISWLVAGVCNAVSVQRSFGFSASTTRLMLHAFDAGHFIALGLASAGLCGVYRRWGSTRSRAQYLALAVGSCALGSLLLPPDLSNMAERIGGPYGSIAQKTLLAASTFAITLGVPIAHALGRLLARPWWRWLAMAIGVGILATHALVLSDFYHGIHLWIAATAATLLASALAGAVLPIALTRLFTRLFTNFPGPRVRSVMLAVLSVFAAISIGRRPPTAVAMSLVRNDGSLLPHFLLQLIHAPTPLHQANIPVELTPWFEDRKAHPPIAPTQPPVLPANPVVILLSIDCLRADVVMSGKYDRELPSLARLRQFGTSFTNVRATSSGTMASLASIFLGTYYSEQYWTPHNNDATTTPHQDKDPRIQELLNDAHVATITFAGALRLTPRYGLSRGFTEAISMQKGSLYAGAEILMPAALDRLSKVAADKPLFLFVHFLDAHAPYNRSQQTGSLFDRYIAELRLVDQQLSRLIWHIQSTPLRDRTLLIVTADHGEAFGEHNTFYHSSTIYDELLHVPLLVWRPGYQPFVVDEPVSLIDLGPTILDAFGVPTPGHFMGQSLVPFLRGDKPKLTRPLFAEARLKQALILPDGHKVIVDNRLHTVELYDLNTDPGEITSLADDEERLSPPLSLLQQFFQVHTNRTPGYTPPYRVW